MFCPKLSRYITHIKKLNDSQEAMENFFEIFQPALNRLGPVLIQLPPFLKFNYNRTELFYELLKNVYKKQEFVMEVRHATWFNSDSLL